MITKTIKDKKNDFTYLRRIVLCERDDEISLAGRYGYSNDVSPRGKELIFLHQILQPDPDDYMHSHPWIAEVEVLSGWYFEQYLAEDGSVRFRERVAGDHFVIEETTVHRIMTVQNCVTMLKVGRKTASWGFYVDGKIVRHSEEDLGKSV